LVSDALGLSRLELYLQFDRPLAEADLAPIRPILRRRAEGEPVAYLLGHKEFCGLSLGVGRGVLIPRPESELLVEVSRLRLAPRGGPLRAADLGTGSGCLAVALAVGCDGLRVDAVDISPSAVDQARENAQRAGVADRVEVMQGSWAEPLWSNGHYDLIVSNPPYVTTTELGQLDRTVRDFEPSDALDGGPDGLAAYRGLISSIGGCLGPETILLLEGDPRRLGAVERLCLDAWPGASTTFHQDLSRRDRVLEVWPN